MYIRQGMCDVMLAGGVEARRPPMGSAASTTCGRCRAGNDDPEGASRPFDSGRDGFVRRRGRRVLVLEELEHARARGATIYGEIAGYGMSSDAHHVTEPTRTAEPGPGDRMALRTPASLRTTSTTSTPTAPRLRSATRRDPRAEARLR